MLQRNLRDAGSIARSALRGLKRSVDIHQRRGQRIPKRDAGQVQPPSIYFPTPDHDAPSGGIRVIYRHVDILNAKGVPAAVVHQQPGFRCTWFTNRTRVIDVGHCVLGKHDLLVLPEIDGDLVQRLSPGTQHVIFNQNSHLTWLRGGEALSSHLAGSPDLLGMITVSEHNAAMLAFAFPRVRIERIHLGLDSELFCTDGALRQRRITYMPRRGSDDARQVLAILGARRTLKDWQIVPLDGLTHEQVAAQLRLSRIFLAFTYQEGFGLPAAEAMACGNYVIGYHGYGGREFFRPEFSTPVQNGDVLDFARRLEEIMDLDDGAYEPYRAKAAQAAAFVHSTYSEQQEIEDVSRVYEGFLQGARLHRAA